LKISTSFFLGTIIGRFGTPAIGLPLLGSGFGGDDPTAGEDLSVGCGIALGTDLGLPIKEEISSEGRGSVLKAG